MLKNWLPTDVPRVQVITVTAMLIALNLVLNQVAIPVSTMLEVSFAFLPLAVMGALYGPIVAGAAAGIADVLGFFLRPNGFFFPGFTLNAILAGVIYGFFLFRKEWTLSRIVWCKIVSSILFSLVLTPIWLRIMYQTDLFTIIRVVKTFIKLPIDISLLAFLLRFIERSGIAAKLRSKTQF